MASSPPSKRAKIQDTSLATFDATIQELNLANENSSITAAKAAFASVGSLIATIRDCAANDRGHIELGFFCFDVCKALDRGLKGRRLDELNQSVLEGIEHLTATVAAIEKKFNKRDKRNMVSRFLHPGEDKEKIMVWRRDLARVLQVFNTELALDTHRMVADIHRDTVARLTVASDSESSSQTSVPTGELPPPRPRACFGRDWFVEKVVGLVGNMEPVALIGAGGIGKTSIALAVLHHPRIKERFGDNRRFIRCDQFPPTSAHFLRRLSEVIGTSVENPEDLTPLRPFLTSKEMVVVLDNAESILDPQGPDAQGIYTVVDELCQFETVCICITSRITTVPRHCKCPEIPSLSRKAACNIFYNIYDNAGRSEVIDDLVQRLDFHALSITLLATTASHNRWDYERLANEWDTQRARALRTDHKESLSTTIELSLASPTFCELGPSAHELLGVIAFFPQGVDEKKLDWLFPALPERKNVFDKFCVLSLAYRSNGFVTMLAPIRDYLCPEDPRLSPLLCEIRDRYIARLSVDVDPDEPGFEEARWIVSEDANIEHLLDVFTSLDMDSDCIWGACHHWMEHLYWHKPRETILGRKIEGLPDDHPSKPDCLSELSRLYQSVGNHTERKRILMHALTLHRRRKDELLIAQTLRFLSDVNRLLHLYQEGIQQAKEASEIYKRYGDATGQALSSKELAWLLLGNNQLDDAEDAAFRVIDLIPEKGQEHILCQSHRALGNVYRSKGAREKAISHFETALGIATPFNWRNELIQIHGSLAKLFFNGSDFVNANAHIKRAKSHAVEHPYHLAHATRLQATIWRRQRKFEEAMSEALRAREIYNNLGLSKDIETCGNLLLKIEREMADRSFSDVEAGSDFSVNDNALMPHSI